MLSREPPGDSRGCGERPASVQGICRVYTYHPLAKGTDGYQGFLGILFQDVGPNGEGRLGRVPGLPVQAGAQRSVFWARVSSGSVLVSFRAGGDNNWKGKTDPSLPYKDEFGVPAEGMTTGRAEPLALCAHHRG